MPQVRQETRTRATLSTRKLVLYGLSFAGGLLIGRVCIGDAICPFGPGYVLAAFLNERTINPYLALAGVLTALAKMCIRDSCLACPHGTGGSANFLIYVPAALY